jgi:hypothetical protein
VRAQGRPAEVFFVGQRHQILQVFELQVCHGRFTLSIEIIKSIDWINEQPTLIIRRVPPK